MVVALRPQAPVSTSVKSLIKGFILTQRTDCKSPRTIEYYESNLRRFLWYADKNEFPDDVRMITEWQKEMTQRIPLGRLAEPQDIADVVLFLASDASRMITGQTIIVDGGIMVAR